MSIIGMLTVAADGERSFIEELWSLFYETCLNPSEYYENLNLNSNDLFSIRIIILGLCIGFCVAGFAAVFNKRVLGRVARKLIEKQAFSAESALTVEELGCEDNFIIRHALRKSTNLRRVVKCREELDFEDEQRKKRSEYEEMRLKNKKAPKFKEVSYKINIYEDSFFIPEELKYTAEAKFDKKGSTWFGAVIFTVIMIFVFIAITAALPYILSLIDGFAGSVGSLSSKNIV